MMQTTQTPLIVTPSTPTPNTSIKGDAAARRFGIYFLSALAVITIGAGVGIGVGNLAHYKYFSPNNNTNITTDALFNLTEYALRIPVNIPPVSSLVSNIKRRELPRLWLSKEVLSLKNKGEHHHQ
ncbi:hypothetical protein I4U23_009092 [Adineta vaga]|nr:hypothetical protein I4U23_009092 [Adineta vaga]